MVALHLAAVVYVMYAMRPSPRTLFFGFPLIIIYLLLLTSNCIYSAPIDITITEEGSGELIEIPRADEDQQDLLRPPDTNTTGKRLVPF